MRLGSERRGMGFKVLAILVTYILAIYGGSPFVTMILRRFGVVQEEGLQRAGKIIGYLERFLVLTLVLHGQYTAIAFIFTGKSIARFESLRRAEYYLVGTFASLSWAIFWGVMVRFLLLK